MGGVFLLCSWTARKLAVEAGGGAGLRQSLLGDKGVVHQLEQKADVLWT